MLYPAADVMAGVAADLGWRPGTPSFPETVVHDSRSARLLRAAHIAAEHGDRLASSSLLRASLAGLLRAHAGSGRLARSPGRPHNCPAAVRTVRDLLAGHLADPPSLDELALATGMSPFSLLRAFRSETGLPPHAYLNHAAGAAGPAAARRRRGSRGGRRGGRLRRPGAPDQALQAGGGRAAGGLPARARASRKNVQDRGFLACLVSRRDGKDQ